MTKQANRTKSGLILPTDTEDAAINRGIAADPDTVEITADLAAKLQPLRRRGRPPGHAWCIAGPDKCHTMARRALFCR